MTFRSDLDALRARHDALQSEVATRQKELVETRRMIEEVEQRARLPVLDNIRVAAPCTADWTQMPGDQRVRTCKDCNKHVYNLSGMTRDEAELLIVEKEGRLCVRYYQRADGSILFGDCTIGVSRRRRRKLVAGAAALLAATGAVAYGASRAAAEEAAEREADIMMGELSGYRVRRAEVEKTAEQRAAEKAAEQRAVEKAMAIEMEMAMRAVLGQPVEVMGDISWQGSREAEVRQGELAAPPAPSSPSDE